MMNNKSNREKTVSSWTWWIVAVFVAAGIFTKTVVLTKKKTTRLEKIGVLDAKAKTQEVIVLKPGKNIPLEINDKEWSPWIDASKVYSYPHTSDYGIKQLFSNGDSLTVKPGERIKLLPKNKGYSIYRLKTPLGIGNQIAIIQASNEPINKELYK